MENLTNYQFSVAFIILAIWSARLYLSKKKISKQFITAFVTTSITFCVFSADYQATNSLANAQDYLAKDGQQIGASANFSPKQGSTDYIVKLIDDAKKSICVAAYSFTSQPIASALVKAYQRGVSVKIVLDKSQKTAQHSSYNQLKSFNIPARINSRYAIMHNKFIIIDNKLLQTGSFNYTKAAELHNAENIIVLHDSNIIKQYAEHWQKLWNESE